MAPKLLTKILAHKKNKTSQQEEREQGRTPSFTSPTMSSERSNKRKKGEAGTSSSKETDTGMFRLAKGNRYLFRDDAAFHRFAHNFNNRSISECYQFNLPALTYLSPWESQFLEERINFWGLGDLVRLEGVGFETVTRLFYANMVINSQNEEFGFTTYMFGSHLAINPAIIASTLDIVQEGEQIYPVRQSSEESQVLEYRQWITGNISITAKEGLYASHLPSVHYLLFLIINNIILCKKTVKTNLENGVIYLLRHLLCMDKKIDISYILVRHMLQAGYTKNSSLPFSHLIARLVGANCPSFGERVVAQNLALKLDSYYWVKVERDDETSVWEPDSRVVNLWIKHPNAAINQYCDPENPQKTAIPTYHRPPQDQPQSSSHSQLTALQEQMGDVISKLGDLHTWSQGFSGEMKSDISDLRNQMAGFGTQLTSVENRLNAYDAYFQGQGSFNTTLQSNWTSVHGRWNVPFDSFAQPEYFSEDEDDDDGGEDAPGGDRTQGDGGNAGDTGKSHVLDDY